MNWTFTASRQFLNDIRWYADISTQQFWHNLQVCQRNHRYKWWLVPCHVGFPQRLRNTAPGAQGQGDLSAGPSRSLRMFCFYSDLVDRLEHAEKCGTLHYCSSQVIATYIHYIKLHLHLHFHYITLHYIQADIQTYRPTDIQTYIHAYMHTCIHAYIHTCIHASMHPCMHTCIHACIHAYMHTCIHASMHPCIHACIHAYTHAYMHTCIHAYMHPCIHASMHTCIHAYMHPCIHASMHPCMHTCMHTCIHAYMHKKNNEHNELF